MAQYRCMRRRAVRSKQQHQLHAGVPRLPRQRASESSADAAAVEGPRASPAAETSRASPAGVRDQPPGAAARGRSSGRARGTASARRRPIRSRHAGDGPALERRCAAGRPGSARCDCSGRSRAGDSGSDRACRAAAGNGAGTRTSAGPIFRYREVTWSTLAAIDTQED
jgi:hypothetical protein